MHFIYRLFEILPPQINKMHPKSAIWGINSAELLLFIQRNENKYCRCYFISFQS